MTDALTRSQGHGASEPAVPVLGTRKGERAGSSQEASLSAHKRTDSGGRRGGVVRRAKRPRSVRTDSDTSERPRQRKRAEEHHYHHHHQFPCMEPVKGSAAVVTCRLSSTETISVNDTVFLVAEPPGEPYHIGRIMEFIRNKGAADTDYGKYAWSVRVNWFYRPRDILRRHSDSRLVFACMYTDTCPLGSLRGRCTVRHRAYIADVANYRRQPNCFWYDQLYDRYIQRFFDVVPTSQILNVPQNIRRALCSKWRFVVAEPARAKELCMAERGCSSCGIWCAPSESVRCALCKSDYHLKCLNPPLTKKPPRGFAWTCESCTARERKRLAANSAPELLRNGQIRPVDDDDDDDDVGDGHDEDDDDDVVDEEEDEDKPSIYDDGNTKTSDSSGVDSAEHKAVDERNGASGEDKVYEQENMQDRDLNKGLNASDANNINGFNVAFSRPESLTDSGSRSASPAVAAESVTASEVDNVDETSSAPPTRSSRRIKADTAKQLQQNVAAAASSSSSSSSHPERASRKSRNSVMVEQHADLANDATRNKLWPFRYFGIHCDMEDVLEDTDDHHIYPRAASRISTRHQATVPEWYGRPVEYVAMPSKPSASAVPGLTVAQARSRLAWERRRERQRHREWVMKAHSGEDEEWGNSPPPWIQPAPKGYVARGGEATSTLLYKPPDPIDRDRVIPDYLTSLRPLAARLGVPPYSTSFLDIVTQRLSACDFDAAAAITQLQSLSRADLHEPDLTRDEVMRFEEGVSRFGSELLPVVRHVGTRPMADIVRFYYAWKHTPSGRRIWGSFPGRRRVKAAAAASSSRRGTAEDDVKYPGDESDESAYAEDKAAAMHCTFVCKFCETRTSARWHKAPNEAEGVETTADGIGGGGVITALCRRCAGLWRPYGVQWESPEDTARLNKTEAALRLRMRTMDEALIMAQQAWRKEEEATAFTPMVTAKETKGAKGARGPKGSSKGTRGPRGAKTDSSPQPSATGRRKNVAKSASPPREICAVCTESCGDASLCKCASCGLTVHASCYGAYGTTGGGRDDPWLCDACENDKTPVCSTIYECVLCAGVRGGALKRTSGNNWVHVLCALFVTELVFGDANRISPVEGIGALPYDSWRDECTVCHGRRGVCLPIPAGVEGFTAEAKGHVTCLVGLGYRPAFELTAPARSGNPRRIPHPMVNVNGKSGLLTPKLTYGGGAEAIDFSRLVEARTVSDTAVPAIVAYVKLYRSGGLSALHHTTAKAQAGQSLRLRTGFVTGSTAATVMTKTREVEALRDAGRPKLEEAMADPVCEVCGVDTSPRWWPMDNGRGHACQQCHFAHPKALPIVSS